MQAEKNNKLVHNFFSLGFVQVINSSLQLLVIPYIIKTIGADGFGVVAVAQVVVFYLSTFTDYGFTQTATRSIAIYRDDPEKVSKTFFRVLVSKLILCAIAFILLLMLVFIIPVFKAHLLLYFMAFAYVIGQALLMNWFFQGMEKMWFIVLTTLIGRILFVALVFLFIKNKSDDFLFLFFMGIGNIVAGALSIIIACRFFKLTFIKPGRGAIVQELKEGWHFTVTNLSMNTCQYANIFILRFFTNDLIVGYFSIAERIFFTAKQVLAIFSQSVYPRICQLVLKGKNQLVSFLKQVYIPFLLCVTAGSILLILLSPQVLYFFSGKEAVHSVFILQMLSVVLVIVCLNIPSTLLLLAMNQKKSYFRTYTLGGVVNIVSNIILVYLFQTTGTIIAIFLTEIFITSGVIYESNRLAVTGEIKPG
jgi:PST family polysaccharide transporter